MRKVGIQLLCDDTTVAMMACEADAESMWDEVSETEFKSATLEGLSVEIADKEYIYTLKNLGDMEICFVDLETHEVLCDSVTLEEIFNAEGEYGAAKIDKVTNESVIVNILDETIVFLKTKLVSFKNDKLIVQIVM